MGKSKDEEREYSCSKMRRLLYLPMIHTSADLGSVASELDRRGIKFCGEEKWKKHKETVDGFWRVVSEYADSLDAGNLKIYQDGLMADGEMGMKIVEESAKKGSRNYKIVLKLVEKGAKIIKTEDVSLLKKEFNYIVGMTKEKSSIKRFIAALKYRMKKKKLLQERDRFIAKTINETLMYGEVGILFLGAYHNVLDKLSVDIAVEQLKDRSKVEEYQKLLSYRRTGARFEELTEYLISPI